MYWNECEVLLKPVLRFVLLIMHKIFLFTSNLLLLWQ